MPTWVTVGNEWASAIGRGSRMREATPADHARWCSRPASQVGGRTVPSASGNTWRSRPTSRPGTGPGIVPGRDAGTGATVNSVKYRTVADLSQEKIVEVAKQLVRADGLRNLGLRRIAREFGVTAPALYGYFSNLDHIVRSLAETQFEILAARFDAIEDSDPESVVRAQSRVYVDCALAEPELFSVLFAFPPDVAGIGVDNELPIATKVFAAAASSLDVGMATGAFRQQDPLIAALTVWSAVHGCATALNMRFGFDDRTQNLLIDNVLDMVIAGLR
jgi:AcrR family transcriptional regulator